MATLTLKIGNVTASRTVDDTKATAVANLIYNNVVLPAWPTDKPLPTTAQERLQAVVDWLAINMRDTARHAQRIELEATNRQAVIDALAAIDV